MMDLQGIPFRTKGPPAPEEQIVAFEQNVGARVPAPYRAFLLEINGGEILGDFGVLADDEFRDIWGEDTVEVSQLFNVIPGDQFYILAHDEDFGYDTRTPPHIYPIGYNGSEHRISISLGGDDYGRVFTWVPSPGELWAEEEDCHQDYGELYPLAQDFAEFWRMLRPLNSD